MKQLMRFGRRVPLPATVQIVHDLLVMEREDNARKASQAEDAGKADRDSPYQLKDSRVPPHG
ncbi:hypothetical protein CCR94_15220 [Rhodoblastus sphagnicola]|uniref:Uncharacterized protein n=1 Tax=Rhodoblastus sphagnicola TaxID=333368 RepID=A0A2S6N4B7_9HYPH|nr:hypothetical protein [Rhodoblastus sphagnicola]MBB4200349.1 hypothetical protein [Rhodoblastus sphagnicola]PPQ29456.1 hypothetical protein CCR94_15220 [Rhodoblastus sphagnicola]